jgi:hypothetical protein
LPARPKRETDHGIRGRFHFIHTIPIVNASGMHFDQHEARRISRWYSDGIGGDRDDGKYH